MNLTVFRMVARTTIRQLKRLFCAQILVLGDSHAAAFERQTLRAAFPRYLFRVVIVGGATVSGLENPNSKTQALPIFRRELERTRAKIVVVLLGEVDTGFVIWYRAEKHNRPVDAMLDTALVNYRRLLTEIAKQAQVVCVSAPLPTIEDDNDWGDIANARREVRATQTQRTLLTLRFNSMMSEYCSEHGLTYVSLDSESLAENGLVRTDLLNADRKDHHYDMEKYAQLLADKLKPAIEHLRSRKGRARSVQTTESV